MLDVADGARSFGPESVSGGGPRFLHLSVETDPFFVPRRAAFENEAGACFVEIAAASPPWLFRADWNLLKVTRRGVTLAGELCRIRCVRRSFGIFIR